MFSDPEDRPKHTVLVVEDEILIRLDLAHQVRLAGFDVIEVDNAEEALLILTDNAHIDLVVTDIRMPGSIDGAELIRWLRGRAPAVKIIVVSAFVKRETNLPVDASLPKPVRIEELLLTLRQLLPTAEQPGPCGR